MIAPRAPRLVLLAAVLAAALTQASGPAVAAGEPDRDGLPPHGTAPKRVSPKTVGKVKSVITITLPDKNATLRIEGRPTKTPGFVREFETPELDPGKTYEYRFEATWETDEATITRVRDVVFKGGDPIKVDMTQADRKNPDKIERKP